MSEYNMTHTGKELDDAIAKVQSGYVFPDQAVTVTENGIYDTIKNIPVKLLDEIEVAVPVPDGYIIPSGTKVIDKNDTYDVKSYASAIVNVPDYEHFAFGYKPMTANASFEMTGVTDQQGNKFTPKGYAFTLMPSSNATFTGGSATPALVSCVYDKEGGKMIRTRGTSATYSVFCNTSVSSGSVGSGTFEQRASSDKKYNCFGAIYFWIAWG